MGNGRLAGRQLGYRRERCNNCPSTDVIGIVGALLSLIFWSSWAGPGYFADGGPPRRRTVIEE